MQPRIFFYSKSVNVFYFVALLFVAGLSLWALVSTDMAIGKRIFAGILLPASIYLAYYILKGNIKSAYKKLPALILDEKGIWVEESGVTVLWSNIAKVEIISMRHGEELYIYLRDRGAIRDQVNEHLDKEHINIFPFKYSGGDFIFSALKDFCREYSSDSVIFIRPQRETWPSEG